MGVAKRREDRRLMMFEDAHSMRTEGRLTEEQAAELPRVSARTFRRWTDRHGEDGVEGLSDRRVSRASHRAAPVDEVVASGGQVPDRTRGVERSALPLLVPAPGRDAELQLGREQAPGARGGEEGEWPRPAPEAARASVIAGDASAARREFARMGSREGVGAAGGHGRRGQRALPDVPVGRGADLERFLGIRGTVEKKGLFCGKVDKSNPAQFGRAMIAELGIDMIPAYSPEWRGARSGRSARTRGACRGSWRWPGSWTWRLRTVTSGTCTCQRSTPSSRAPRGGRGSCLCPTPACWTTSCARCTSGRWVTIGRHLTLRGAVAAVAG